MMVDAVVQLDQEIQHSLVCFQSFFRHLTKSILHQGHVKAVVSRCPPGRSGIGGAHIRTIDLCQNLFVDHRKNKAYLVSTACTTFCAASAMELRVISFSSA